MLSCFDFIRDMDFLAVMCRLLLAMLCGGVIGIEREYKRRPAGFRTHILICLGASMTTLTSQYLFLTMHMFTDVGRLGAQVIAGIGFIGAGTIIVTKRKRVKGLTTAAGLWTSAIIGLVCGAGYVECAIFATVINSSLNKGAIEQVRSDILAGKTKLLYVAPESLTKEENVDFLRSVKISFYAAFV